MAANKRRDRTEGQKERQGGRRETETERQRKKRNHRFDNVIVFSFLF